MPGKFDRCQTMKPIAVHWKPKMRFFSSSSSSSDHALGNVKPTRRSSHLQRSSSHGIPGDSDKSKIRCLRISFIGSMIVAAAVCGSVSFVTVQQLEHDLAEQTYFSVAASALKGSKAATRRKIQACELLASIISYRFPNASQWPFVALPGFTEASKLMLELSASPISMITRVLPEQVSDFEAFAFEVYREQGYPDYAGVSDFGFGIWRSSQMSPYPDGRIHDTTGNTTYGSVHPPALWSSFLSTNMTSKTLLYNIHSEMTSGQAVDNITSCSLKAEELSLEDGAGRNTSLPKSPACGTVSGFLELKSRPGPSAVLYQPIYPVNDPVTLVGLTGTAIPWEDVLVDVVPDSVDGLYCVISTEIESHTFIMDHGVPIFLGHGDFHDPAYDKYGQSAVITDIESIDVDAPTYTLTVYPSSQMFEDKTSWYIAFGFVMVIALCTLLFLGYDYLMRNQSRQNKVILDVKRRFVRFISHEIRTPLNTVCLGLELLQSELNGRIGTGTSTVNGLTRNGATEVVGEQWSSKSALHSCLSGLVEDILENANNAVGILNDLLNYDKMEQGTFKLELGPVRIWDLVQRTVAAFDIQAKKRAILLDTRIDNEDSATQDLVCLQVLGDDVRLRQVIRNIISNSLKFSPENTGTVHVTLQHNPDGLPNAVIPRTDLVRESMSNDLACQYPRAGAIRILVQDNGVGMTQDQLRRLFQEGVQFEPNTLQDGGGSGLGLHITKSLIEQHGGTIEMFSEGIDHGCLTIIELPLYRNATAAAAAERSKSLLPPDSIKMVPPSTVSTTDANLAHSCLIVDDALSNRKMLVRLLERSGHICKSANNGQEAVDMIKADQQEALSSSSHVPIDTILMDYEMPVLNGPDATKVIRAIGYAALIIGVTGNVLVEDVSYFLSMGANRVLPKPVNIAAIEECWETLHDGSIDEEQGL